MIHLSSSPAPATASTPRALASAARRTPGWIARGASVWIGVLSCIAAAPSFAAGQAVPPGPEPAPLEAPEADTADDGGVWNSARVLRMVERARTQRQSLVVDSTMHSYRAQARGYVYFFMDRPDEDLRSLVKADQIALEVLWEAPNRTRQHIAGLRDQEFLPTSIRYHMDHLTVVQDDFGDRIRMGDGDEVSDVLHPVGPGAESVYDFLLIDSLTLRFPEGEREIRVFQVRVRPKRLEEPGFIGHVFLDQATGAIVRMNFSFTPASYVDPYVDYIRVSLDNSLWMGRHWLPYRQEVEIRREIPLLDFMAGSVIRGRFDVRDYEFNVPFPPLTFAGRRITSASPNERAAFPFERGLLDDLEAEGLTPTPALAEVEAEVREVVEDRYLTGLAPLRFFLPRISEGFRYNRAEGLYLGAGATVRPTNTLQLRVSSGFSFGRSEPYGALNVATARGSRFRPELGLYWNEMRDIGGHPGAPPLENTIAALSGEEDFLDPFFVRGAALTFRSGVGTVGPSLTLRWENHREAWDVVSDDLSDTNWRPVRGIDSGTLGSAELSLPLTLPAEISTRVMLEAGRLGTRTFGTAEVEVTRPFTLPNELGQGEVSGAAGWATEEAPAQSLYLIGGRHTLPGYGYRDFAGDRYWLVRGEATLPVHRPWVGIRLIGAVGATYLGARTLPERWTPEDSGGVRASLGAGLSIAWDMMRIDLARGLDGGEWEAVFSVAPGLRPWI